MKAQIVKRWLDHAPPKPPRCDMDVKLSAHLSNWRRDAKERRHGRYADGRVDQCTRDAVVELDGRPLCRRHAGEVVLDALLSGELVEAEAVDAAALATLLAANVGDKEGEQDPEGLSFPHGLWLLRQIARGKVEGAKAHRWLGWGQCLMAVHYVLKLDRMAEVNREALKAGVK